MVKLWVHVQILNQLACLICKEILKRLKNLPPFFRKRQILILTEIEANLGSKKWKMVKREGWGWDMSKL